jgi:hypothetical protein
LASPPGKDSPALSEDEQEFGKDMQIGDFNFKHKNFRGGELRFRDAFITNPINSTPHSSWQSLWGGWGKTLRASKCTKRI